MSGPAIRAVELARQLAHEHDVRLVSTTAADISLPGIQVARAHRRSQIRAVDAWCDILVFQGLLLDRFRFLVGSSSLLVVDLYDPFHLEQLEIAREATLGEREWEVAAAAGALNQQLQRGDFFLCASEKQRDFWLGALASVGRINPRTYDADSSLRALIDVVPFGVPASPPERDRRIIRDGVRSIKESDTVVLWGGGLYPWLDPFTLIHAMHQAVRIVPDLHLVLPSGQHPNPHIPPMATGSEARALAADLGLLDRHVHFLSEWVEYAQRGSLLLDADFGVSTHLDHVETRFSFRTRILDYLWAGLPVISTAGDFMGDLVDREGLGLTVPADDVPALTNALIKLASNNAFRAECHTNVLRVRDRFAWEIAAQPLLDYCRVASPAPDLGRAGKSRFVRPTTGRLWRIRRDLAAARRAQRRGGWTAVGSKLLRRIRRRLPSGRGPASQHPPHASAPRSPT